MNITITAYGIAKDLLGSKHLEMELEQGADISALKKVLFQRCPDFQKLKSLSFAVSDQYREDSYKINEHQEVVIIPPVSGG